MLRWFLPVLLIATASNAAFAENWPQWRGPKNDGISNEKNIPAKWSETENVVWKLKMPGTGSATPCIWGEKIFLTAVEKGELILFCVGTDGQDKWKKTIGKGNKAARDDEGNSASASCSTDGKLVFAFVGDGHLVAYDFDGNEKWTLDTQEKFGKYDIQFGAHWTPVLFKDHLYFTLLHRSTQQLLKIEAATGKIVWKVDRKSDSPKGVESPDVYTSPFIWEKGSEALVVVHGNDYCTAHKLTDGSEVWRVTDLNPKGKSYNSHWRAVSSPLVTPDLIVVPSCKDGVTVAIDPSKAKGEIGPGNAAEIWRHAKFTPDVPSPLLVDGVLYIFKEKSSIMAYDAKTGKQFFNERITEERHRANPAYADGKVFLIGRDGSCTVLKAGKEFEVLGKMKIKDTFTASPAFSGERLYLRGFNYLWAIGSK